MSYSLQQRCGRLNVAAAPLVDFGCDIAEVGCQCQPLFRASTAACKITEITESESRKLITAIGEEVTCDFEDYLSISLLIHAVLAVGASLVHY